MYLSSGRVHLCSNCYVTLNFSAWHDLLWGLAHSNSSKAVDSRLCIITERGDQNLFHPWTVSAAAYYPNIKKKKKNRIKIQKEFNKNNFAKLCFRNKYIINKFWFVIVAMRVHSASRKCFIINVAIFHYSITLYYYWFSDIL